MTAAVAHITKEIASLAPDEVRELFEVLQQDLLQVTQSDPKEDEASIEARWDEEIDTRAREVADGKINLIPGADFQRSTDALFVELGLTRPA
jgi:hypothetical protein